MQRQGERFDYGYPHEATSPAHEVAARPGWAQVQAVVEDQLYEVKSSFILQPGPAALTEGVDQLARIITAVAHGQKLPAPRPGDLRAASA